MIIDNYEYIHCENFGKIQFYIMRKMQKFIYTAFKDLSTKQKFEYFYKIPMLKVLCPEYKQFAALSFINEEIAEISVKALKAIMKKYIYMKFEIPELYDLIIKNEHIKHDIIHISNIKFEVVGTTLKIQFFEEGISE